MKKLYNEHFILMNIVISAINI